jgi:hypothetical protein
MLAISTGLLFSTIAIASVGLDYEPSARILASAAVSSFGARVADTRAAGLSHLDRSKAWQDALQATPYPDDQILAGWVLKALNLVQVVMIEALEKRRKDRVDLSEVQDPALRLPGLALDGDDDLERMAVQSATTMPGGRVGQVVRGLNLEATSDLHLDQRSPKDR